MPDAPAPSQATAKANFRRYLPLSAYGGGLKELDELDNLQPEKPPEMVNCARCGTSTTSPKGPVFRRVGGELECDVCYGCDGRNELQLAATATWQTKVE